METISVVLISLDHAKQGVEGRPGVWKLEVWVDSAGVSLHKKQVGIIGKRIRAYYDTVETIGIGADGLPRVLAKTVGSPVPYSSSINFIEESRQISRKRVPIAFVT